jgi:hypothetical protein
MNRVLIVSYDLSNPGRNYEQVVQKIKSYTSWARLGGSAYLILTESAPSQVRDSLWLLMDKNDKIYVGVAPVPSAWEGMPNDVANWILKHQPASG